MLPLDPKTLLPETLKPYLGGGRPGMLERYLLDADDADEAAIADRMDDVKAIWDRSFEHPRYGQLARAMSDEHDDAALTLLDPTERARLAADARVADEAANAEAATALADWRDLLAEHMRKGGLTPNARATLERIAKGKGLDATLVRAELDRAPEAPEPTVLRPEVRAKVRQSLHDLARDIGEESVGLTLYHALGLPDVHTDLGEVERRHREVSTENSRRALGTTATLYKTVLANVKLYLLDSDPRAYIEGLVVDITASMEFMGAKAAVDGLIDATEAESLLQTALSLGLNNELGRRVLAELARQNDASVQTGAAVDYVACPACNTPHARPTAPAACKRCGIALFVTCPADACGTVNDATALRCSACGTDLQKYAQAVRRLASLPEAVDEGRIAWVGAEIEEIGRVLGADAVPAELRRRVATVANDAEVAWTLVENAIAERRLYAARTALRGLIKTARDVVGPTGDRPATRAQEVDRRLVDVDAALARARAASSADREAALVEAIALAEDCEEAINALAAIPPAPPGAVRVELGPAGPVIEWTPSPTPASRYLVRRIDGETNQVTDLMSGSSTRSEDPDAASGALVRYEVLTVRGRTTSTAVRSSQLLVAREVQGLTVADADGEVRLSWRAVPASARVIVRRSSEGGGPEVNLIADRTGLVDRNVRNSERYRYQVTVEYTAAGVPAQTTAGVTVYGQPAPPPEGIEALAIRSVPGGVLLSFAHPPSGTVSIIRCAEEPAVASGDALDPSTLNQFGQLLSVGADGARDSVSTGICWYLPVTVAGGTAIAGQPTRHLALADIANVSAVETPGQVRVTWEWPAGVKVAKVLWRRDRQPNGPDEPGTESAWVRLGEYRDNGGFTIETGAPGSMFVAVVPAIRVDGELIAGTSISKGSRAALRSALKGDVRYGLRVGRRKKSLEVHVTAPDGVSPPSLVLVARSGDLLPRTASDGDVLARFGGDAPLSAAVDISGHKRPMAVRMFLESTSSATSFQLFDPSADDLLIR